MKKKGLLLILSLVISFVSLIGFCFTLTSVVKAADTISYETADVISIGDIASKKTISLLEPTRYYYEKNANRGSLIFKFDLENNEWIGNSNMQIYFVIDNGSTEYWWNSENYFWFKNDNTYMMADDDLGEKKNKSTSAISADNHSIEIGRLAIIENKKYTGNYYVYIKVDGVEIMSNINAYDYAKMKNEILITGNSLNTNKLTDPNFIEQTYETPDEISVGDLKSGGKLYGNKIIIKNYPTLSYDRTATYGSVVFKFTYKNTKWAVDDDGSQFHLSNSWQENGMFWLRPDHIRITTIIGGKASYIVGDPITAGTHEVELGRLAVMKGTEYTNKQYFYIKIDGKLYCETTIINFDSKLLSNYIYITGQAGNSILDEDWEGNTITYVSQGTQLDQFITTEDYLTKPANPTVPEGKTFLGWFDEIGKEWDFENDIISGDMTLTAGFKDNSINDDDDEEYFNDSTYTPVLRFFVTSDTHITTGTSRKNTLIEKLFDVAYQYAENSTTYNGLDAGLFVGDVSDDGSQVSLQNFINTVNNNVEEGTELVISMGNHDWRGGVADSEALWKSIIGEADSHVVINGYHFIALSPDISTGEHFSEKKVAWLDQELAKAAEADPTKPIFLMQHEGIQGTIYGSEAWGVSELTEVICKYPQVVDWSGHSHYPLADPRIIWQGTFTAIGTSTLNFYEVGINGYKNGGVYPSDKTGGWSSAYSTGANRGEFQIVEIDADNNMRVIFYDLDNDCEITRYYIRNAMDERKVKYSHYERAKSSVKPAFDKNTVLEASVVENKITVEFDQAICSDIIESYRIELYNGSELVDKKYALSDYFFNPVPERIKYTISYLKENTAYTLKVYAVNVWGDECEVPITTTVTTDFVPVYTDVIDELTLSDLYSVNTKAKLTTDTTNAYLPVYFKKSENNYYGSFKLRMQLLYIGEDFQVCFDEEFENPDLVWINNGNNVWFIKDNFKSDNPISVGLHTVEYGRYHINEGDHRGYTAFYVKVDDVLIHTCESERSFTDNGYFSLNFRGAYAAGSRYYDIDYKVPTQPNPVYTSVTEVTLNEGFTDWTRLGGEITFKSSSPTLEFYLEDANGRVSENKTFEGNFILADTGCYYTYLIKTNAFTKIDAATGNESIVKFCPTAASIELADLVSRVYVEEVLCDYDVINVLDVQAPDNNGIISSMGVETKYNFVGTSSTYSAVFKYYIVCEDLNSVSEFRTQVGTIWTYSNTLWLQPGDWSGLFFSWDYSTRPTDKYSVNFQPHTIYEIECGTIFVEDGEWKGYKYTYLKLDGKLLTGFYAPGNECVSKDYTVTLKVKGGYKIADISLGRNITYVVDGKEYTTKFAVSGVKTYAPVDPVKEGFFFNGWYTAETGGERVDFSKVFTSNTENVTYYARFADTAYDVKFYSNNELIDTVQVGKDGFVLRPDDPEKTGEYKYQFINWLVKGTNNEYDFNTPVLGNVDLEAHFEEYEYKIVYIVDGKEYTTRTYKESDKSTIIGGEPAVPTLKGATGRWVYSAEKDKSDIYAKVIYDGVTVQTTNDIKLDKFDGKDVDIANDLTRFYLNIANTDKQAEWLEGYPVAGGNEIQDIKFSWTDSSSSTTYLVYFADNINFEHAFIVETQEKSIDYVGIFTPGKTYYWKVLDTNTNKCSEVDTFNVLNTPVRWISAGTVFNMRDIGGWTTTDGHAIAYDKIYRGGQLSIDIATERSYMNDYSKKVFDYLGIKTEIELRGDSTHTHNQINDLETCIRVNGTGYTDFFKMNDGHKKDYRAAFAALADENNYPFYFHCSWGADRTGGLGFLINAVLGVPYEQLVMDFELTSLSYSGFRGRYTTGFYAMYQKFMTDYSQGGTLQDAVTNFLTSYVGVPMSDIVALKSIMLKDSTSTIVSHKVTYMVDGEIYQEVKVFDGGYVNSIAPVYFDKCLAYWSLNGEEFDMNSKVTSDLTLVAVFDESDQYEEFDVITLRDVGIEEGHVPEAHEPYNYVGSSSNGTRLFEFDYSINITDGVFDDGVHVELGPHIWTWKAHVWIAGSTTIHIFTNGESPTQSLAYEFEIGKTYRVSVGVLIPLKGENAGKKMLILMIDGEILGMFETKADITSNKSVNLAGTEGKMYSTDNKQTINFVSSDSTVLQTVEVTRGELLTAITEPTQDGKVFLGWFDELGNKWDFATDKVLKSMKLIAKFGDKTVSALVIDENDMEIQREYKVKVGLKVSEITLPSVNNSSLQFEGWYNGSTKLSDNDVITEDMNLICKFKVVEQQDNPDTPVEPSKKGCSSSISVSISLISMVLVLALLFVKEKRCLGNK